MQIINVLGFEMHLESVVGIIPFICHHFCAIATNIKFCDRLEVVFRLQADVDFWVQLYQSRHTNTWLERLKSHLFFRFTKMVFASTRQRRRLARGWLPHLIAITLANSPLWKTKG